MGEKAKDEIRHTYPSYGRYLQFPETSEDRGDLDTFVRRRGGAGSWEMVKRCAILLIKIRIASDQKRQIRRHSAILIIKLQLFITHKIFGGLNIVIKPTNDEEAKVNSTFPVLSKMGGRRMMTSGGNSRASANGGPHDGSLAHRRAYAEEMAMSAIGK